MSGIQAIPVEIVLWVGAALVLLALAQAATALYGSLKRNRFLATQQNLAIRSLNADIELKNVARSLEAAKLSNRWSGLRKFRVNRKVMEGGGICSFYLVPHDGKPLPQFEPGQYLTFNLQVPDQSKPVVRCYSLSDSPYRADQYYRVSIKHQGPPPKEPDAPPVLSSTFFHQNLDVGATRRRRRVATPWPRAPSPPLSWAVPPAATSIWIKRKPHPLY